MTPDILSSASSLSLSLSLYLLLFRSLRLCCDDEIRAFSLKKPWERRLEQVNDSCN